MKKTKLFIGKDFNKIPKKIRYFMAEKILCGWTSKALQKEISDVFGLLIPETFICC